MRALFLFGLLATSSCCLAAIPLNQDVRPDTIASTICVPGYTKDVRPATNYTNGIKRKYMRQAGLDITHMREYELDHIVPLALGGCPDCENNLQLQPWDGPDGAKKKDRLEVKLQCLVCTGQVPLAQAQQDIFNDWQAAYHKYALLKCHRPKRH